eukprot:3768911-Pyramimonas_sp.AAC.1
MYCPALPASMSRRIQDEVESPGPSTEPERLRDPGWGREPRVPANWDRIGDFQATCVRRTRGVVVVVVVVLVVLVVLVVAVVVGVAVVVVVLVVGFAVRRRPRRRRGRRRRRRRGRRRLRRPSSS